MQVWLANGDEMLMCRLSDALQQKCLEETREAGAAGVGG